MNILILQGSPRKGGNSDLLADEFARAAAAEKHEVTQFRITDRQINGCLACEGCWKQDGLPCVQQDGMQPLYPLLNLADLVVFATPLYYYGFSAQMKAVIDRFYPFGKGDKPDAFAGKQCAMIVCGATDDEDDFEPLIQHYERICDELGWEDIGVVAASGLWEAGDAAKSEWMEAARDLAMDL